MDREFHCEMTALIAAASGFAEDDAWTVAASCQQVDDNTVPFRIEPGGSGEYLNYVSRMEELSSAVTRLMRLYPVFHFPPGDPLAKSVARKDGRVHPLVTTPDCAHARTMMARALASRDPYRIGVAAHVYADSFAHQNFTGSFDGFNAVKGGEGPAICHSPAGESPDIPCLVWTDERLVDERVDNRERFLAAASGLFALFLDALSPETKSRERERRAGRLLEILDDCMAAGMVEGAFSREACVKRCREAALLPECGGRPLPEYDPRTWFDQAVMRREAGYFRRDPERFRETPWYFFQSAVKAHQREALALLGQTHFPALRLPDGRLDFHAY